MDFLKNALRSVMSPLRDQGNSAAVEMGFSDPNDIDSFRHAYTAGKMRESVPNNMGETVSRGLGTGYEMVTFFSNTPAERESDLRNNEIGMQIAEETRRDVQDLQARYGLSYEEAEARFEVMFRDRIAQAVRDGRLKQLGEGEAYY